MNNALTKNYDNWKLTDWREELARDMPRTLNDYHIDQFIVEEVSLEQKQEFFEHLDRMYEERYNFENLNIAEHNIVGEEPVDGGVVYTIKIVWANVDEVIVEDDGELEEIIAKEIQIIWDDDKTIEIHYEVDVTEEYWG